MTKIQVSSNRPIRVLAPIQPWSIYVVAILLPLLSRTFFTDPPIP